MISDFRLVLFGGSIKNPKSKMGFLGTRGRKWRALQA
jgi:hypothetical protein